MVNWPLFVRFTTTVFKTFPISIREFHQHIPYTFIFVKDVTVYTKNVERDMVFSRWQDSEPNRSHFN